MIDRMQSDDTDSLGSPPPKTAEHAAFAQRLAEICDDMGLPEHGRQTLLARRLGVVPNAVGKWLHGQGFPALQMATRLAVMAGVHQQWLLQGPGAKLLDIDHEDIAALLDGLRGLPRENLRAVWDFIEFELLRNVEFMGAQRYDRARHALSRLRSSLIRGGTSAAVDAPLLPGAKR